MGQLFNIYCDESCHLENDQQKAMTLGAVWCQEDKRREIAVRLREIKKKHHLPANFEIKWTKVSLAKIAFYLDIIDYFFDDGDLFFRCLIIPDKTRLKHATYNQTHDDWYYKMYFTMLKTIIDPNSRYRIYIDIKDTLGQEKVNRLHDVLCNNSYDFSRKIIERIQRTHSHDIEQLQLVDLLIGALSYLHRDLQDNEGKNRLIERIKTRSGYKLTNTTMSREQKLNLLVWEGH